MKKIYMNLRRVLLFSLLVLIISSAKSITAKAAVTATYDKVVELNMINSKSTGKAKRMYVDMDTPNVHIANVKTSSKYLKAKATMWSENYCLNNNKESISMYGTKKGRYNMTFDIVDSSGNVLSSESVLVIVCPLKSSMSAFKSIKIGNTNVLKKCLKNKYTAQDVMIKKTGKLNVKMKKGYTLKSMQITRCVKRSEPIDGYYMITSVEAITEDVTNGSWVTLSDIGYNNNFYFVNGDYSYSYNDSIYAYTFLTLTYIDKKGVERQIEITLRSNIK